MGHQIQWTTTRQNTRKRPMSSSIAQHTWHTIQSIHAAQRLDEQIKQQALVRLFEALERDDRVALKALIDQGISVDSLLLKDGETSHPTAERFFPENFPCSSITAMGWAAWNGDIDVMERLINLGADPWLAAAGGRDSLWLAGLGGNPKSWEYLEDKVPDFAGPGFWNARAAGGMRHTRLMEMVTSANVDAVAGILSNPGVDVEAVDKVGRTALHLNMLQSPYTDNDQQIGRMLIDYGAPVKAEDHDGVSPAALADTPEQQALMNVAGLREIAEEARIKAAEQKAELEALRQGHKTLSKDDADFEQIKKMPKMNRPKF